MEFDTIMVLRESLTCIRRILGRDRRIVESVIEVDTHDQFQL